jgi:hypothetical protein
VLDGCDLCRADDDGSMRDGDMQSGVRLDVPEGSNDGDLLDNGRAELLVHGDGQ